ncbi:MAG: universal stress protein [Sphingomonadales bacterium]|nr:MAG: universal stress protein [Sphingomonadales bacterium]
MKNVLVLMHDDAGQEARFQAALDLTRALDGHLTCIDVSVVPVAMGDYGDLGGAALLMADEQVRENANKSHMLERLAAEDVSYDWRDESGFLNQTMRNSVGLADVVVLNRKIDSIDYPDMRDLVGDMVITAHTPIVAVPQTARGFDAFGHALVAWDGSRESVAALRAAAPLLANARAVTILEVDDGSIKTPAEDAAAYLSRHGIKPLVRRQRSMDAPPSAIILDTIRETQAAYLVMGGFGHSRFVESMFGGVTRRMLKECPVPLLLAH